MKTHFAEVLRGWLGWCPETGPSQYQGRSLTGRSQGSARRVSDTNRPGDVPGKPSDRRYEHTQTGKIQIIAVVTVMIIIICSMLVIWSYLLNQSQPFPAGQDPTIIVITGFLIPLLVLAVLVVAVLSFATLTVALYDDELRIRFGPLGLVRRTFPLADIMEATAVKNPWYYGWGIRWTPSGPLYNVAGKDAVEIRMASGKSVRIGTDEPETLLLAIEQVRTVKNQKKPAVEV